MGPGFPGGNRALLSAAVLLASSLAEGRNQDELDQLSAFFAVVGDALALLSLEAPEGPSDQDHQQVP